MDLTVVIPFCNGHDTIHSLLSSIPSGFPVIVVDDRSDEKLRIRRENTRVFRLSEKGYFSGAVNFGISNCSTDVLVLNQDTEFTSTEAFELLEHYHDKYALIGEAVAGTHPAWPMGYVHGTFMFMRRDAIKKVGLLNDEFYPLWGSTCEWQLRICRHNFLALPVRPIPGFVHKRHGNYGSSIERLLKDDPSNKGLFIRTPPLVSVIVPAYNHAQYLPELINSLIGGKTALGNMSGQSFQAFDVLIADDCSTDNTSEVMKKLADPWKGIKYLKTDTNSGTSVACNLAIRSTRAKYIARIDADDMRDSTALELMLRIQMQFEHSFVYDDVQLFSGNEKMPKVWKMREYDFDELTHKNFIHAGIMFPKQAWEDVGGYPEEMRHGRDDWAFNIALGLKGWCGVHLNNAGYLYRRHSDNRTLRNTTPMHRESFRHQIMTLFPEAFGKERPMACCGGGRRSVGQQSQTYVAGGIPNMPKLPGAGGLVLIQYNGLNVGDETYFGAITGSAYKFSARKNRKWVDPRDLHAETSGGQKIGLLDLMSGNKYLFELFREPVAAAIAKAKEIAEEIEAEEPAVSDDNAIQTVAEEFSSENIESEPPDDFFAVLKGVGKVSSKKLIEFGIKSMTDLAEADTETLMEQFGWSMDKAFDVQKQASYTK